jgi:hypothetical protein
LSIYYYQIITMIKFSSFRNLVFSLFIGYVILLQAVFAQLNYKTQFLDPLNSDGNTLQWSNNKIAQVTSENSFRQNISILLFPGNAAGQWNALRPILQTVWFILLVVYVFYVGVDFIRNANDESWIKKTRNSLLYISYWWLLYFGSFRLVRGFGIYSGADNVWDVIWIASNTILSNLILLLKAIAYIYAVVMIMWRWFEMIRAYEKEDKFKAAREWIVNVLAALAIIKTIDYLYFISSQSDFSWKLLLLVEEVTKLVWFGMWAMFVFYLIYAWFTLATSWWEDDKYKKAINTVKAIAIIW